MPALLKACCLLCVCEVKNALGVVVNPKMMNWVFEKWPEIE